MQQIIRFIICSLVIFFGFVLFDFNEKLTLFTLIFCALVLGFGLNMFWDLYRRIQKGITN